MLLGWRSDSGVDSMPNMGATWVSFEKGGGGRGEREGRHVHMLLLFISKIQEDTAFILKN